MSWVILIGFGAIGQAMLMAAKFAIGKRSHQRFLLISLFLILAFYLLHEVLVESRLIIQWTFLFGWGPLFPMIIAPLLFLYVRSLLNSRFVLKPLMLLHLIPFVIALISRGTQILSPASEKAERLKTIFARISQPTPDATISFSWPDLWHLLVWHFQPMFYFGMIVWVIRKSEDKMYGTKGLAQWMKYLAFGLFLFFLLDYLTEVFLPFQIAAYKPNVMIFTFSIYVFGLCLVVLNHPSASYVVNAIREDQLSKDQVRNYFKRLEAVMFEKKIYLKPDLSLAELAKEVGLAGRELSQVISLTTGFTFNDYLNDQRVIFAKSLLENPKYQNYTMAAIGEESGFRSKDAFYRAFKKFTSETPKAFLERISSPDS